jgi:hypothetical protein
MASRTVFGRSFENAIDVTGFASNIFVLPVQHISRTQVIKLDSRLLRKSQASCSQLEETYRSKHPTAQRPKRMATVAFSIYKGQGQLHLNGMTFVRTGTPGPREIGAYDCQYIKHPLLRVRT